MLKEYQGALNDLDKADILEPNNASTLRSRGKMSNTCWMKIKEL
jgi:hypothetical protein